MSKNLLNESQIRQFMKLARLEPLTPGFVQGLSETHGRGMNDAPQYDGRRRVQEEEEMEAELGATEDELGAEDEVADEEGAELADMEAAAPEAAADEGRMISVDDFLGALETALEGVMGDEVEIDSTEMSDEDPEAPEEEEEMEMDVELAPDGGEEVEMDAEEELMETGADCSDDDDSDELVEQITKRVAARILKSALRKK
jgi:hypothetical protein